MYQLKSAPVYRRTFNGSAELFTACWRQYRTLDTDPPTCDADAIDWLDQLAAEESEHARRKVLHLRVMRYLLTTPTV